MESRDRSDLEVEMSARAGLPGEAPLRFDVGAGRGFVLRLDLEMRFWGLETNKDRHAGLMFERVNAGDYWRSQKASSTVGARRGRRIPTVLTIFERHETIRQRRCSSATNMGGRYART